MSLLFDSAKPTASTYSPQLDGPLEHDTASPDKRLLIDTLWIVFEQVMPGLARSS